MNGKGDSYGDVLRDTTQDDTVPDVLPGKQKAVNSNYYNLVISVLTALVHEAENLDRCLL